MRFALASIQILKWTTAVAVLAVLAAPALRAQEMQDQDPPDQAGRISAIQGTVSIEPVGSEDWGQAYQNLPVGPGDRIYTDQDGWAEVQVGQTYVRFGPNTDITLVGDNANSITWGLAQGSVHTRTYGLWQGQTLNFSTPNGDVQVNTPGEIRVDAIPDQNVTIFSSLNSSVLVSGAGGYWQQLGNWQSLELAGTNPVYPEWLQPAQQDYLDQWSRQRDQQIVNAASYRYVNPEVPGASELDAYGDWTPDSDYGPMWFPREVPADWQPYRNGHWINRDPWGWVWVEDEPWGYAPFHYGRWVVYRGRWGWVPGPREVRPVWSPALVVFAGGIHFGGASVSAWFPLGPGEAYRPWYRCSPRYVDRVNISNIRESRVVHVQNTYVNVVNVTNVTYINRNVGVTAMRPEDFAAGRQARQSAVQVDQRQFDRVQVVDRPAPVMRQSFVARPVARPIPVKDKTPVFINQQGMQITARPGATPIAPRVQPVEPPRPIQGRVVVAPPAENRNQNNSGNGQQQRQFVNPNRPQQNGGVVQQPSQPQQTYQPNAGSNQNTRQGPGQYQNQPAGANNNQQQQPQRPVDARPVGRPIAPLDDRGPRQMLPAPNGSQGANSNQQPVNPQPKPQTQQMQPFQQTAPQPKPIVPPQPQQQQQMQQQQMQQQQRQSQPQVQRPQPQPQAGRPQDQKNNRDQNRDQKKDQKKDDKKDDKKKD